MLTGICEVFESNYDVADFTVKIQALYKYSIPKDPKMRSTDSMEICSIQSSYKYYINDVRFNSIPFDPILPIREQMSTCEESW